MFSQHKVTQFTLNNYHWLLAILLYQFILNITVMSYTEITNTYIKIGLVFLYSIITWAYLTLIFFMHNNQSNLNMAKSSSSETIINTGKYDNRDDYPFGDVTTLT